LHRILITGGTGFVGNHLIRHLHSTTPNIMVMASGSPSALPAGVEYYGLDIRREDDVRSAVRQIAPSEIYHLAGVSAVDLSWSNPRLTFEVNIAGTYNLLEAAMGLPSPPRILNISTAQVYARSDAPLTESSPVAPDNPYAASKAIAELLEVSFRKSGAGGVVTARSFNHTGPGQLPTFVLPSFAKQFAEIEAGTRPSKLAVGNIGVERDFTDVRDVVRAYSALLSKGKTGQVYNVCSGIGTLLSDVIKQFQALCRTGVTIETDPTRVRTGDIPCIVGDSTKIRNETGWNIRIPMSQTIRDLLDYWREKVSVPGTMEV
jgi:GDP-4-dehydro-6-deoxy-D-mannose reductase